MTPLQRNAEMPWMQVNWAAHAGRTGRLTLEERGFYDLLRCELWSVAPPRMPAEDLLKRLRLTSEDHRAQLAVLLELGLLTQDGEGWVQDDLQAHEFAKAVAKSVVNSANGKLGGRPRKVPLKAPTEEAQVAVTSGTEEF